MAARDTVATVPSVYQRPAKLQGKLPRWEAEVEVIRPAMAVGVGRFWRSVGCDMVAGVGALSRELLGAKPQAAWEGKPPCSCRRLVTIGSWCLKCFANCYDANLVFTDFCAVVKMSGNEFDSRAADLLSLYCRRGVSS
jgi:hypothetical protein